MQTETQLCPECNNQMTKHFDESIMCSLPAQQGFVWICVGCRVFGERGSYTIEDYQPRRVGIDQGDWGEYVGNVCIGRDAQFETIVIEPHDWQNPNGD